MTELRLAKLQATGNDFLVQLALDTDKPELDATAVAALCDRHRGIGADARDALGRGLLRRRAVRDRFGVVDLPLVRIILRDAAVFQRPVHAQVPLAEAGSAVAVLLEQ